ncbi:Gfo/Idh/MocA family protein [Flavobacteriaceae bacterium M23B6Z8]
MSEKKQVNWGILGAGKIARKFTEDLKHVPDARLYAVAARKLEGAKIFASEFNIPTYHEGYENMLKDMALDIVYIATPHAFHHEHTLLCLNYKKAVLCEKPFALNKAQVEEMIAAAKENKVLLMEALWTAFLPHFQYVQELLKKKTFGEITRLEADFGFPADPDPSLRLYNKSLGGGSLLDIGIYPVYAALVTLGVPDHLEASATFTKTGVDSSCDIHFNYNNGAKAILKSTFLEETPTTATFYCENGIIKINSRFHEPSNVTLMDATGNKKTIDFDYASNGYSYEAAHLTALYQADEKESPIMSFVFSLQLISLLDKIREEIGLGY